MNTTIDNKKMLLREPATWLVSSVLRLEIAKNRAIIALCNVNIVRIHKQKKKSRRCSYEKFE